MVVVPLLLLLWARQQLPSATVVVSFAAMPLMVALLTSALEGRTVPYRALQATIAGLGGITLAVGITFSLAQAEAAIVVLCAVFATGASSLVARRELKELHPCVLTAGLLGPAALLLFAASLFLEHGQPILWNRGAVVALLLLASFAGGAAYSIYFWLLQEIEAYQLATVQWLQPLVGMIEGALYLRMGFSFTMIAGSVVTLGSVLMVMRAREEDDQTASLYSD
jgi:drug/metabolite transporter (DMT)-like permease